ncbi:M20 family metallopeptidase [Chloroflexota bacterium]
MKTQEVFTAVEKNREYLIETLRQIVAVDTSVPPGLNYGRLADVVEPIFRSFSFRTERVIVPEEKLAQIKMPLQGERVNLVASKELGLPPVSVYAHMDVVPVEGEWKHDPFGGEIEGAYIYGRGVSDMKGAIAALLTALKVMHDMNLKPHFDIHCMICSDEEIGVYPGAYHLALEGYFKGHFVWLEPGYQDPLEVRAAAGIIDTEIIVTGKSCHSGFNFLGVNALEESIPILDELMALKREVQQRESATLIYMTPTGPMKATPMFNIDIINSGIKSNIVPAICRIVVNRRYLPEENYEDIIRETDEAIARGRGKSKAIGVKVEHTHSYVPSVRDINSEFAERARRAKRLVHGYEQISVVDMGGSLDMGFVIQTLHNDKVVTFGPRRTGENTAHSPDERIAVADLVSMAKEILLYLTLD